MGELTFTEAKELIKMKKENIKDYKQFVEDYTDVALDLAKCIVKRNKELKEIMEELE